MAYNGWENYETWNVALWFGNDEGLYHAYRNGRPHTAETAEALARKCFPNGTPDFGGQPKRYDMVDWAEIAEAWNEA